MADEEKTEEAAPAEGGKKLPIIIIVVLILVGLVLAGGISYFVTTQFMSAGNQASVENRNHDPGVFVKLGDAKEGIIVNVGGIKSSRFLKVGITVELNPENENNVADGKLVPAAETKIMDAARQDDLKSRIKSELNKVLGEGSVYDVYITSFMLQ